MKGFKIIAADIDGQTSVKIINALRLTKKRFKTLHRYARNHSHSISNCGHEWDCCGCLCSQRMELIYNYPFITITYSIGFNF